MASSAPVLSASQSTGWVAAATLLSAALLLIIVSIYINWLQSLIPRLRRLSEHGSSLPPGRTIRSANRELARWGLALGAVTIPIDLYALLAPWQG